MPKNLEIKTGIKNPEKIRKIALNYVSSFKNNDNFIERQKDIYYIIGNPRLKLRIINNKTGNLIYYSRNESSDLRISDYIISSSSDPLRLDEIIRKFFKPVVIVEKIRRVFLADNVRIHLDNVKGLGNYLEFEIIFNSIIKAEKKLKSLILLFGLNENKFIKNSYSDLILNKKKIYA